MLGPDVHRQDRVGRQEIDGDAALEKEEAAHGIEGRIEAAPQSLHRRRDQQGTFAIKHQFAVLIQEQKKKECQIQKNEREFHNNKNQAFFFGQGHFFLVRSECGYYHFESSKHTHIGGVEIVVVVNVNKPERKKN